MNFLELCQRTARECGMSGVGPASAVAQTGIAGKMVNWVNDAYMEILGKHQNWRFLWRSGSFSITTGKDSYVPAVDFGVKLKRWDAGRTSIYRVVDGPTGRYWPDWLVWPDYSRLTRFPIAPSMPQYFALRPDEAFVMWPPPDQNYTLETEFWAKPARMAANVDLPLIPEEYQMVIVWRAVMMYAGNDEAPVVFANARGNYTRGMADLEEDQLEFMLGAEPLA